MEDIIDKNMHNNHFEYCSECGKVIPSKFIFKTDEINLCFYCNRRYRPKF